MKNVLKDNRGYMLVEIIVASVIAFTMAYFLIDITLKLTNKNNDYYLDSVLSMDKNIVTKEIMDDINSKKLVSVDCSIGVNECLLTYDDGASKELKIENNSIVYGNYRKKLNDKLNVSDIVLENSNNILTLSIPAYTNYSKEDYGVKIVVSYSADIEVVYPNVNYEELTKEYSYSSNAQIYTVSQRGTYKLEVWGAQGGSHNTIYTGGKGGHISGTIFLNQGDELIIMTGGQDGTNGGGIAGHQNGGGATLITLNGNVLITGAGGGGASSTSAGGAGGSGNGSGSSSGSNGGGGSSYTDTRLIYTDTCTSDWDYCRSNYDDYGEDSVTLSSYIDDYNCGGISSPKFDYIWQIQCSESSYAQTGESDWYYDSGYYYKQLDCCEKGYRYGSSGNGGTSSVGSGVTLVTKIDGNNEGNGHAKISFVS